MLNVTIEKSGYIITHYSELLTLMETKALRHYRSTLKLEDKKDLRLTRMYLKIGWLSDDPVILNLLSEGYVQFTLNCAERILKDNPDKVFFTYARPVRNSNGHHKQNNAGSVGMIGIDNLPVSMCAVMSG